MKQPPSHRSRIAVKLDAEVDIEAVLLGRLERLPARRREEWLRALLLKGFQKECRELRKLNPPAARTGPSEAPRRVPDVRPVARAPLHQSHPSDRSATPSHCSETASPPTAAVSMATLRHIIGADPCQSEPAGAVAPRRSKGSLQ